VERTRFGWNARQWAQEGGHAGWPAGIHAAFEVLADGRYLAFGRRNDIRGCSPFSISSDQGKTWTYRSSGFPPLSGGQRPVLMRLQEGPLLLVSEVFTDHPKLKDRLDAEIPPIAVVDAAGTTHPVHRGTFAALSQDEGETWPITKLIPQSAADPYVSDPIGYLFAVQTPDKRIHLISTYRYYCFNLAWLKQPMPAQESA
jgi:hypothetical protein